jgi:hypothetical protein
MNRIHGRFGEVSAICRNRTYLQQHSRGEKIWEVSKIKNGGSLLKGVVLMSSVKKKSKWVTGTGIISLGICLWPQSKCALPLWNEPSWPAERVKRCSLDWPPGTLSK